jgi:hypothetical protein
MFCKLQHQKIEGIWYLQMSKAWQVVQCAWLDWCDLISVQITKPQVKCKNNNIQWIQMKISKLEIMERFEEKKPTTATLVIKRLKMSILCTSGWKVKMSILNGAARMLLHINEKFTMWKFRTWKLKWSLIKKVSFKLWSRSSSIIGIC